MILVETVEYETAHQLRARERYWIENLHASLNSNIPNRTDREYRQDNNETIVTYSKQYYQNNKERVNQYVRQYRQNNKETIKRRINCDHCNCTFSYNHKSQHIKSKKHIKNFKAAYLECWGEPFTGTLTSEDY